MRLHHLEITAFGPFADTVNVDFDALSESGLFLLSGPTGAGKSSVLDAVCFALYGDVPGDRAAAKRLRSDHALPGVAPRVVLTATLAGRRFRIDRSPAWIRAKKRGTGETTEQARVVISEQREDGWQPLSTRLDETGHLITRLVGMTLPQFCQVALLPQGRFQAFLRAKSEERHALLQQVFATGRFDRVERWLRERRVELRRASDRHREGVADLLSRASEVAAASPPELTEPGEAIDWARRLTTQAAEQAAEHAQHLQVCERAAADALEAAQAGAAVAERQQAHAAATRANAALAAATLDHAQRRSRLDAARRAHGVRALAELATRAEADLARTAQRAEATRADLAALLGVDTLDASAAAEHERISTQRLADLERVRPLRRQVLSLAAEIEQAVTDRTRVAARLREVEECQSALPEIIKAADAALASAEAAARRARELDGECARAQSRVASARAAEKHAAQLVELEARLAEVREQRLHARERLVEIRERRLDSMAAEIATQLAVGQDCPVCGSADHPSPATPTPGAPDEAAEREARRAADDLEAVLEAHAQQVRGVERQLASARTEAGGTLEQVLAAADELTATQARSQADAADLDALTERAAALHAERDELAARTTDLRSAIAAYETQVARASASASAVQDQIEAVLPDGADPGPERAHHERVITLARSFAGEATELIRARGMATTASKAALDAAEQAGFASAADAVAAWLDDSALADLSTAIEAYEREAEHIRAQLADPELAQAAVLPAPDVEALERARDEAARAVAAARQSQLGLSQRTRRLHRLTEAIEEAIGAWQPLLADLDQVTDLAALVEGKHPDNRLHMRLSAYVLAHRLGQVVQAANLRLATMSGQRYTLVHTGQRGAGETRGGLSLMVADAWTGDERDPATLSGGETFVVSLALALGLADVITAEAGGADLDTLFVDEGFGSLDADTLEDVIDTLDALRDGGRVVGVVSHVPELQTRIPTQLRVEDSRAGSRVSLALG